ncbi:MAG: cytochrome b/b6 domain-containing protein [Actinobacteria bacterium]|nr:cytochrome b/b6 domain-containing protein [Actinomycetota bacterium]
MKTPPRTVDEPVRMTVTRRVIHWSNALSVVAAAVTGMYIANPYYAAQFSEVMAWNRAIHLYAAVVMDVSIIAIAYLYFFSRAERPAAQLVPSRKNMVRFWEVFLNFVMLNRRKRFDFSQPDPYNTVLFVILHVLVAFQLLTGLQLYVFGLESGISSVGAWWPWVMHTSTDWTLAAFGGIGGVRRAHHTLMYPIIAWTLLHIYYEVWRSVVWGEGDVEISIGGYKHARAQRTGQR